MRVKAFKSDEYDFSDRRFQLLFYQVSHGEMIIRSNKTDIIRDFNYNHTIDIYFGDVKYMEIPSVLDGITFRRPNDDDVSYINSKYQNEITEDEIVVIISNKKEYYIIASVISIIENQLSYMELPIQCFLHDGECVSHI